MGKRLEDPRLGALVEVFDPERYNQNATLAENLLFGTPVGETFDVDRLAAQPLRGVLDQAGLTDALLEVGLKVASTMVELFADLPPDHEYFRQFSFISADDLPDYRPDHPRRPGQAGRAERGDRERLIALPLKLIPARHRLGLIDEALQARVLEARRAVPRAAAGGAARQRRVLRGRALQHRGSPAGQHPVRQDRLRPGAGGRADRRPDQRGAVTISACASGWWRSASRPRPGSAARGCRSRSGRSWRSPAPSSSDRRS